jgi:hypothetical protein
MSHRSRARSFAVLLFPALAACGSDGGGTGGAATTTSTTTASVLVPPNPSGAAYVALENTNPAACNVLSNTAEIGSVDDHTREQVIADGDQGDKVDCLVKGSGTFEVHGKLDETMSTGNYVEILIPSLTADATPATPAEGKMTFAAPWTAGVPYTGDCQFYFETTPPQGVDTGKVWISFACATVTNSTSQSKCAISKGYAIFEGCLP